MHYRIKSGKDGKSIPQVKRAGKWVHVCDDEDNKGLCKAWNKDEGSANFDRKAQLLHNVEK